MGNASFLILNTNDYKITNNKNYLNRWQAPVIVNSSIIIVILTIKFLVLPDQKIIT